MPTTFSYSDNSLATETYLTHSQLTRGNAPGVNDPTEASAIAPNQFVDVPGDVDIFAVTLIEGRQYTIDIDDGAGDGPSNSVDLEFDLIDTKGSLIETVSNGSPTDRGSDSTLDPRFTFTINRTGTYYIAVHSEGVDYRDDEYRFTGTGGTGDYSLVFSSPEVPNRVSLTSGADDETFSNSRQNILAQGGNDEITLLGGDDIASGGNGDDELFGGAGDDELSGNEGSDRLEGGDGSDALVGGEAGDVLKGGGDADALNGLEGNDRLIGGSGGDSLLGHSGRDLLNGGLGGDFLRGGVGVDRLVGGDGSDVFHFLPGESDFDKDGFKEDFIRDFENADDIDLSDLVVGRLDFIGKQAFSSAAGEVRIKDYRDTNDFQEVRVNLDSDKRAELAFLVQTEGDFRLRGDDFLL